MPIAAVPKNYLGQDFKDASPGMRFSIYLPIWTERDDQENQIHKMAKAKSEQGNRLQGILHRQGMDAAIAHALAERGRFPKLWEKNSHGAKEAWDKVKRLSKNDQKCMKALADRQSTLTGTIAAESLLCLEAVSTAPFTTGLGNEHPLENGFAFLNPYGLPYLPGSGVKGVLRQAARELASGEWDDSHGWSVGKNIQVTINKKTISISTLDALFGLESNDGDKEHLHGALSFWDVIPQIAGDSLMVEVMTPHQSHYYQQKRDRKTGDSTTPHDSGQPTPIHFLTVPERSGFTFHVVCDLAHLRRLAPNLAENSQWKTLIANAFEHAFHWLGFGAKTAVGYGAMAVDQAAEERRRQKQAEAQETAGRQRQLAEATAGLPEDAADIERRRLVAGWADNNTFLDFAEQLLTREALSPEALQRLKEELEHRWKGILGNPDATQGKKNKPKYKDRPKKLAKKLLELAAST